MTETPLTMKLVGVKRRSEPLRILIAWRSRPCMCIALHSGARSLERFRSCTTVPCG